MYAKDNLVERIAACTVLKKSITGTSGGATVLKPYERNVEIAAPASGAHTIKMPPVTECAGTTFSITAPTATSDGTVAIAPFATGESQDWPGNFTLNANLDRVLLYSDGKRWWATADMS